MYYGHISLSHSLSLSLSLSLPFFLSLDEFFSHDFLKDPCSLPSEVVFGSHPPAPHTKSSPVPIKRHSTKGRSPHTSPRLSASPVSNFT